ncbi:MBL fold metallo-hydrolase [Myroides odoratimimus]|uniref:Metallo-beta-lactamase domain-containing protein n=1 Tax=Myroides odoratimimus TaxID=76832 RepID=A0AAI8G6A5_9FLAO|nr:MBL fold metallo-hydrolase [Myroides odoratimimus]ALU27875.1 hypothetical protein AS202_17725 [Myroides odoratimimus]MCS7474424.1 MBL fold metallo-hydrolase [Myroides odoratimimus]MDM1086529.1 MBL fold metallo-hydrolase [Myroides odoratimimus]
MKVQLIRNATININVNNKNILVDPMLGSKGVLGPFPWTDDTRANPLTELPFTEAELNALIHKTDAVLLTHLHPDHWDPTAQTLLPKDMLIYCQNEDIEPIKTLGFHNVIGITDSTIFEGIHIHRTVAIHGEGEIGHLMGNASGFVLSHNQEIVYLMGDTIWCKEVKQAIDHYQPTGIVINGGAAKFAIGEHVTMNSTDIKTLLDYYPIKQVAIVHLEAISPLQENRNMLKAYFEEHNLSSRVIIPNDADIFTV